MPKNFVLDTNVLLADPKAIFRMDDNNIIIPDIVLDELDRFKSEQNEIGHNSREVSRYLDALRTGGNGNLVTGASLGEGKGKLRVESTKIKGSDESSFAYDMKVYDNRILSLCFKNKSNDYILVSKDTLLRVKAGTLGIVAEDYLNEKAYKENEKGYTGRIKVGMYSSDIELFRTNREMGLEKLHNLETGEPLDETLFENEFLEIYPIDSNNSSATLGRCQVKKGTFVGLKYENATLGTIQPRNIGQKFMMECLLQSPDIAPLVIFKGIAGTAKTLFALAGGLYTYANGAKLSKKRDGEYNRILICRPQVTMDENIGFLPGTEKEKISPYMRAIKDNVFTIYHGNGIMEPRQYRQAEEEVEMKFEEDFIKTEALAYQRGRSLNHYWFILDEMQNSTINQAKAVVTRGGIGTKVILLGDPDQIDSPYLDSRSNGLSYTSEKMKGSKLCWQVTMYDSECERSALAEEAAKRM